MNISKKIKFGDGLTVTDEGDDVVRIDVGGSGGGGGIQFDTSPQSGNWLYVETTNSDESPNGWGIELNSQDNDGIWIHADNWNVLISAGHRISMSAGERVTLAGNSGVNINGSPFNVSLNSPNELHWQVGGLFDLKTDVDLTIENTEAGSLELKSDGLHLSTKDWGFPVTTDIPMFLNASGPIQLHSGQNADSSILMEALGSFAALTFSIVAESELTSGNSLYPQRGFMFELPHGGKFSVVDADYSGHHGSTPLLVIDYTTLTPTYHIQTGASWIADL